MVYKNQAPAAVLLELGVRIAQHRRDLGLSQEAFGEAAGLHRTYIGHVERGENNLTLGTVILIAQALDLSLVQLFSGIEIPPRKP